MNNLKLKKNDLYTYSGLIAAIVLIFLSCKKEISCETCASGNLPPIAMAGADQQIILPADSVLLNGSSSYDPDGTVTTWFWTKLTGPASFQIASVDSAKTVVKMLVQGIYLFELRVTDDKGEIARDTVQITVSILGNSNQPPIACAGPDQTITLPLNSILLNGSCSADPDNNITGYQWIKISGPSSFTIANATGVQTQVVDLVQGIFLFQLKVTDAGGLFSFDTVQITVNPASNNSLADIYVAGMENSKAVYWKNGQAVILNSTFQTNAWATSIAVEGNDVYVSGIEGDPFVFCIDDKAKYWKNGQEFFLTGGGCSGTYSIAVNNNDVYVAGWENSKAVYWKNGQAVYLTPGNTSMMDEATCIVIKDGDIYVSGHENGVAKYWKNNVPVTLTNGTQQAYAFSIAVIGTDVYVSGSESNGSVHIAKYWKNGQPVTLSDGTNHAFARSIAVSGNNVHVVGYQGIANNNFESKYWVNGQEITLPGTSGSSTASSIYLHGTDVYVTGWNSWVAKYWKNSQPVTLSGALGSAMKILVVPQ